MKRRKNALTSSAQIKSLYEAIEQAGIELSRFIDFIQYHNPHIDKITATKTAAYCLHNLPILFLDHPEMMQELSVVALQFSKPKN